MQATTGWFIGILEGEGNFDIQSKRIRIKNTDLDIIENCEKYLRKNNILFNRYQEIKKTKTGKNIYNLYISNQDCKNLYNTLEYKLECRRQEFQQLVGASETLRCTSLDLDWLIGIWQAEGTFCISKNYMQHLCPSISICNSNKNIIEKIRINLINLNCTFYCKDFIPTVKKPYTMILISGHLRCYKFLSKTENLWLSKKDTKRTNLIFKFLVSRLSKAKTSKYCEEEIVIYNQIRELNK